MLQLGLYIIAIHLIYYRLTSCQYFTTDEDRREGFDVDGPGANFGVPRVAGRVGLGAAGDRVLH